MEAEVRDWVSSAAPPHETLTESVSQMSQYFKKSLQGVIYFYRSGQTALSVA